MRGYSLVSNDGKVFGSDEGIKLGLFDVKVLVTILGNIYGITPGINVGIELVSLDGSFYVSNNTKLGGLFLGDSLLSTDGKVFTNASNWDIIMLK